MKIFENYSLIKENTFRLSIKAKYFTKVESVEDIKEILSNKIFINLNKLVIGQGANILFTKDFDGLVIKNEIFGINIIKSDNDCSIIEVGAGENWHSFVSFAVNKNLGGIENLALIPGTVGAAPVQNIAAYGQNMSDVFQSLVAINMVTGEEKIFYKNDCDFKYRDSYFKSIDGKKYFVTKVTFSLSKDSNLDTSYFETGKTYTSRVSLKQELEQIASEPYFVKDIYNAVVNIRTKKLPNIKEFGNAGSFFKNPVVTREKYNDLTKDDPDLQCYPVDKLTYPKFDDLKFKSEDYVKIPGGRLLDNLGWKGKKIGNVGTYKNQAMAIVNYGGAKPEEIVRLYQDMQRDVFKNYGIKLEPEVNII